MLRRANKTSWTIERHNKNLYEQKKLLHNLGDKNSPPPKKRKEIVVWLIDLQCV